MTKQSTEREEEMKLSVNCQQADGVLLNAVGATLVAKRVGGPGPLAFLI